MNSAKVTTCLLLGLALAAAPGEAQTKFDPRAYQDETVGGPTRVLVLGTLHLSNLDDAWDPSTLEPLLDRLARFDPDVITIENLSGRSLSTLWEFRALHGNTATRFGGRALMMAAAGRVGTGLSMAEAEAEARSLSAAWPDKPTVAQRRRMAATLAAAGDPNSALIHWWSLDASEQVARDGINSLLRAQLNEFAARRNESALIGARLASRLGLPRVHPVDSHGDAVLVEGEIDTFARELFRPMVERLNADPRLADRRTVSERMQTGEEVLESYRLLNREDLGRIRTDLEWGGMLSHPTHSDLGRKRVAGWEIRNLRMAANIRGAIGRHPGSRVLVIVGATHKPWLEAYLGMMSDIEIVEAQAVLR